MRLFHFVLGAMGPNLASLVDAGGIGGSHMRLGMEGT